MPFRDREDAGRALAGPLDAYRGDPDAIVLGLPRGGVVVAAELARALALPLDVYLVRKLGVPGHEELAMGALASGGVRVLNETAIAELGIGDEEIARATAAETRELARREREYRGDRGPLELAGRTAILVDDGLATGASMRAAALALRARGPRRIVIAVPVAPRPVCDELRALAEEVVCLEPLDRFRAVGASYEDFTQTEDDEVHDLLVQARR